jgi:hypothetical protein
MAGPTVELADFHPATGHAHECAKTRVGSAAVCQRDCANVLFAIAQDQERSIVRTLELCDAWDAMTKGESPTTAQVRARLLGGQS